MREKFSFSRRTNWPLNVNPLSAALSSLREQNILILDLTESNPTRCGFQYPTEKILSSLAEAQNMIYSPS
ncbi:MAG TPA: pyridoxal phosphate-dependent aminotransferase, partial [Candidatus Omnitrophota bacterium]|nr:pyridoxal phosphate-dependent aminotransferase [Candidatus Omnitrophota bacterium]